MISEEFYLRIKRWEAIEAHWEKLYQSFSEKLLNGLFEIVYEKLPWLSEQKKEKEVELEKIIQKYIRRVWDNFEIAYSADSKKEKVKRFLEIPGLPSKDESAKELKEKLNDFPEDYHETFIKYHWKISIEKNILKSLY